MVKSEHPMVKFNHISFLRGCFLKIMVFVLVFFVSVVFAQAPSGKSKVPFPNKVKSKSEEKPAGTESKVIAKGRGIIVTQADVDYLLKKFRIMKVLKNREALEKRVVMLKLFALEAKKRKLATDKDDFISAAVKYEKWFLKNYEVPEDVILSYYLAHYKVYLKDGKLPPLDNETRKEIRDGLIDFAKGKLLKKEAERLMKEYNVTFVMQSEAGEKGK